MKISRVCILGEYSWGKMRTGYPPRHTDQGEPDDVKQAVDLDGKFAEALPLRLLKRSQSAK